jgi:hypothetical protein
MGSWRAWVWTFIGVQVAGVVVDAIWHGLLHPDFEPRTIAETVRHLTTVHLLLYVGVLGLCAVTAWALFGQPRRPVTDIVLPLAFAGALLQLAGEAWHAYVHLQLQPSPWPELIGFGGLAVVIGATIAAGRHARSGAADARRLGHEAPRHQPRG